MTRRPRRSWASVDELLDEWTDITSRAERPSFSPHSRYPARFGRGVLQAAAALLVVAVVGAVLLLRPIGGVGPGSTPPAGTSSIPTATGRAAVEPTGSPGSGETRSPSAQSATPSLQTATPRAVAAGTWRKLPPAPIEDGLHPTGVWTGSEFVVWGSAGLSDGAAYDPATDTWRALPAGPGGPRRQLDAVWTGDLIIAWDGGRRNGVPDGGVYDPVTDAWRPITPGPLTSAYGQGLAWTGTELLVLTPDMHAAAYDPATEEWRDLPTPSLPSGSVIAKWIGAEWLVLAMGADPGEAVPAASFDPESGLWRTLAPTPLETTDEGVDGVWTGDRLVIQPGHQPRQSPKDLFAYHPVLDRWEPIEGRRCPTDSAVWTGEVILRPRSLFDPTTGECQQLPQTPKRDGWDSNIHEFGAVAWTGSELIVWGGGTGGDIDVAPADGAAFSLP